ncbi:hypothetical protein [Pseudonocardia sp. T1-2H]|uniref:hypothetical protein n=1 Tax=Pseudonocardia sp. T1-2H TaxID=3128899 RepID=UPI0031013092
MVDPISVWDVTGNLADWFAAIGTVGALAVAAKVYRQQVADNHSKQASQIILRRNTVRFSDGIVISGDPSVNGRYTAHNYSSLPIYYVLLCAYDSSEGWGPVGLQRGFAEVLGPGEKLVFSDVGLKKDSLLAITFKDASGAVWRRRADGVLREDRPVGRFRRRFHNYEAYD